MSPDGREDGSAEPSLLRRVFLKLGVAGAGSGLLDRTAARRPARGAAGGGEIDAGADGGSERAASRDVPPAECLPPRAALLSARGLDSARSFALSSVASDHDLSRRPLSVRELVTPQTPRRTTDADTYDDLEEIGRGRIGEMAAWLDATTGDRITWGNWLQDPDHATHGTVVGTELSSHEDTDTDPGNEQRRDLIGTVVRTATGKFRGFGSGHSHSEAAMPREGFNDLKNVDGKLPQPDRWLKDSPPSYPDGTDTIDTDHLVRVGAGTLLKTLNRSILPDEDLALPNMGSWDGQTLAGAVNTSTHGTGLELGSLADIVRSVEILVVPESPTADEPLVRLLRIDPDDGITDPVAFARDAHDHDMTLIQDDDLFHSVVVGYGSMGVVYAYTIECRDPFWLRETNEFPKWNDVDPVAGARQNRHYKVNINLAAFNVKKVVAFLSENQNPVPGRSNTAPNPQCWVRAWNVTADDGREPTERKETIRHVDDFLRDLPDTLVETPGARFVRPPWWRRKRGIDPFEKDRKETASYIALRRRRARHPDEPERPPEQPPNFLSTEVVVPLSETEAAAQAVIDHVYNSDRWFPAPLSIRYAAGSEHYLSPEYGLDDGAAIVELLMPAWEGVREGETDVAKTFRLAMRESGNEHLIDMAEGKRELEAVEDILVGQFDGRPHLGKHNTVDTDATRDYMRPGEMFPAYDTWLAAHRYVNQYGTFDAKFTDNKVR